MEHITKKKGICLESILHIPLSQYAFATEENVLVLRLRAKKGDLKKCILYYGDRVNQVMPIPMEMIEMELRYKDKLFDYFEVQLSVSYSRVCYYFYLENVDDWQYYYDNRFTKKAPHYQLQDEIVDARCEYYQYPFILRSEVMRTPKWFQDAVVYNIFPDSFANGKRALQERKNTCVLDDEVVSKNRLGGTIKGIIENIDYLYDLGFTCLYLNPVFAAGEYHKYDTLDYYHIDPCFGTEDEFKELVNLLHKRNMRIIIDGVFNHCSWYFFAFNDVIENGEKSRYCKWFYDLKFPVFRPEKEGDSLTYTCFAYVPNMPKLNTAEPEVQKYFADVGAYWIREFHVDGWRLDVANEVSREFWHAFHHAIKEANSEAILIGEVWENAETWLRGDAFDSVMNYEFRRICREYIAFGNINDYEAAYEFEKMWLRYSSTISRRQLNLLDSHDVPRFLSLCGGDKVKWELACILLFFLPGVPSLFYGDEQGISGILECEYRKNMEWNESGEFYEMVKKLLHFRNSHINNVGESRMLWDYVEKGIFAFVREGIDRDVYIFIDRNGVHKNFLQEKLKEVKTLNASTEFLIHNNYLVYVD